MKTWAILNESLKRYWNDLTSSWVEAADAAVLYVEPEAAHEEARRLLKADGSMQLKIVEILPDSLKRVDRSQVVEESIHEFAAWAFGALKGLAFKCQNMVIAGHAIAISTQLLDMIPYVATVVVLVIMSLKMKRENQSPAALGNAYFREER
jgi:hypothetical protein